MDQLSPASLWILDKYLGLEKELEKHLSDYEIAHSISGIYNFLWDDYADWYVEYLKTDDSQIGFAKELFRNYIVTISPYMPFESQAIWQDFFGETELLADYIKQPIRDEYLSQLNSEAGRESVLKFGLIIELIKNLRSTRGLFRIDPATKLEIISDDDLIKEYSGYIELVGRSVVVPGDNNNLFELKITSSLSVFIDIKKYIGDVDLEISRTDKEIKSLEKQINQLEAKLSNQKFVENAAPEMIQKAKLDLESRKIELANNQQKKEFLS